MQLIQQQRGKYMVVRANGRLDATWAEYFTDVFLGLIRNGHHQLVIDASEMSYLSSAGIRSLLGIYKELRSVRGSFIIVHATSFIANTIEMTGFKSWLSEDLPEEIRSADIIRPAIGNGEEEIYVLDPSAELLYSLEAGWEPWEGVEPGRVRRMSFPRSSFAIGIGSAADNSGEAAENFGDFLAVDGHVILQPPQEKTRPDFLFAERDFVPELLVIQALCCRGEMSHLVRFAPVENLSFVGISRVAERVLEITNSDAAAFVLLAETDGLVGATLISSPGLKSTNEGISFPGIRDWLSFSGERVYHGQLALTCGIITRTGGNWKNPFTRPLPSKPGISGHFHAAVFPYQPLQNGRIDLEQTIRKISNGPPPLALLHLVEDNRPATGLGQSSFIRGACWCAAMKKGEEGMQ